MPKSIKTGEDKAVPTSVSLLPRHLRYIKDNFIKLSSFVQGKIDEEINKKKGGKK